MMDNRLTKWDEANECWLENHDNDTREWKNGSRACMDKLAAYEDAAPLEKVREWAGAFAEGRAVVLFPCAGKGDPKPPCFYTDLAGAPWCLGMARVNDDYPIANCQKCWYSEYSASEREEAIAALEGREGQHGINTHSNYI